MFLVLFAQYECFSYCMLSVMICLVCISFDFILYFKCSFYLSLENLHMQGILHISNLTVQPNEQSDTRQRKGGYVNQEYFYVTPKKTFIKVSEHNLVRCVDSYPTVANNLGGLPFS